jgi:hypothetical protein
MSFKKSSIVAKNRIIIKGLLRMKRSYGTELSTVYYIRLLRLLDEYLKVTYDISLDYANSRSLANYFCKITATPEFKTLWIMLFSNLNPQNCWKQPSYIVAFLKYSNRQITLTLFYKTPLFKISNFVCKLMYIFYTDLNNYYRKKRHQDHQISRFLEEMITLFSRYTIKFPKSSHFEKDPFFVRKPEGCWGESRSKRKVGH